MSCETATEVYYIDTAFPKHVSSWWRHQVEAFSALLVLCEGNPPVTGGFPSQRPVRRSFGGFFIRTWTNDWANNRDAVDLRRHRADYDVTLITWSSRKSHWLTTVRALARGVIQPAAYHTTPHQHDSVQTKRLHRWCKATRCLEVTCQASGNESVEVFIRSKWQATLLRIPQCKNSLQIQGSLKWKLKQGAFPFNSYIYIYIYPLLNHHITNIKMSAILQPIFQTHFWMKKFKFRFKFQTKVVQRGIIYKTNASIQCILDTTRQSKSHVSAFSP